MRKRMHTHTPGPRGQHPDAVTSRARHLEAQATAGSPAKGKHALGLGVHKGVPVATRYGDALVHTEEGETIEERVAAVDEPFIPL